MIKKIINYIKDNQFKIVYFSNNVNVINYDKILEVKNDVIMLEKDHNLISIKGQDLKLNKLLDNEILVTGIINQIEL